MLVKEQVFLDQQRGSDNVQIMLEGDLIVPDVKPDMALLLQTDENVIIDRAEAGVDRVNYLGRLNISLLYVAKEVNKTVQAIQLTRNIDDFVNLEGVTKDMWVKARAEIVNMDYRVVNDRKVNYRAVINMSVVAEESAAHEVVVHMNEVPDNQLLKGNLHLNRTVERRVDKFQIKDQITLPSTKPNLGEILQTSVNISSRDVRLGAGRANLSGELFITTIYRGDTADTQDSLIELLETELPFNGTIDIAAAKEDMLADATLQVLDQHITIRPNEDGEDRILDIEISVGVEVKVYNAETVTVLEDAYSINQHLHLEKTPVSYPSIVCINRNQAPIKEVVTLGDGAADMLQIFRVKGQMTVDDIKVIDDKVIAEGAINTDILYVAGSDATPLASYTTVIPFRQVIEAKGAKPGMHVSVLTSIDHVAFNMLSPRETEVRFQLAFNTQVAKEVETSIISNITIEEMAPELLANQPSMRVYIVQPGDTLWKIAKRYNTPLDEIVAINELESPSKITTGQKLLMLK